MIEEQFRQALQSVGLEPPAEIIVDGQFHIFPISGKQHSYNVIYQAFSDDKQTIVFGLWKEHLYSRHTLTLNECPRLSPEEEYYHKRNIKIIQRCLRVSQIIYNLEARI